VLDLGGTFVFAISGAMVAVRHRLLRAAFHGDPAWLASANLAADGGCLQRAEGQRMAATDASASLRPRNRRSRLRC
jgi:hypothetical protein